MYHIKQDKRARASVELKNAVLQSFKAMKFIGLA